MINKEDILHRTTYVWKDNDGYAIIIKNDGNKVILNKDMTIIWKIINDEDSIENICNVIKENFKISEERIISIIKLMIDSEIVTNMDMFWGDEIL